MAQARQELLAAQTSALGVATPGLVANGPVARVAGLLYQVYFAPLAFWEAPNYAAQTRAAEAVYLANPLNSGWHTQSVANNLVIGGVMLGLTLAGLAFGALALLRPRQPASAPALAGKWHALLVVGAWSAATVAGLLTLNIIWQRYYLPLEPIVCLWAAYGAASLARPFTERLAAWRAAERPASQS